MTKRDVYQILRMDECIDSLGKAGFLNGKCQEWVWQVEINCEKWKKTVFTSHYGLYRILRMPSELRNASSTFQETMAAELMAAKWKFALVYLDDIVVLSCM